MIDLQRYRDYEIDHEPGGWPAIQMKEVSALVDEIEQQRARVKELEAIKLGLTKTLIEMEAERAKLVEALDDIGASWHYASSELEKYMRNRARAALAAYRIRGGEQ